MNCYICRFSERHDAPRTNFDNFLKAMLAVFQVGASIFQPPFPHNILSTSEWITSPCASNLAGYILAEKLCLTFALSTSLLCTKRWRGGDVLLNNIFHLFRATDLVARVTCNNHLHDRDAIVFFFVFFFFNNIKVTFWLLENSRVYVHSRKIITLHILVPMLSVMATSTKQSMV